jgi:hypothetical protein
MGPLSRGALVGWFTPGVLRSPGLAAQPPLVLWRGLSGAHRGSLYLLGAILALAAFFPVIGFFVPVLLGLSFVHYLLSALRSLREAGA